MIQCKIFSGQNSSVVERQINTWLESQHSHLHSVEMYNTTQSSIFMPHEKTMRLMVTIFYKRVKK